MCRMLLLGNDKPQVENFNSISQSLILYTLCSDYSQIQKFAILDRRWPKGMICSQRCQDNHEGYVNAATMLLDLSYAGVPLVCYVLEFSN